MLTISFTKSSNDRVTYIHDDDGMRFVVNRLNSDGDDTITVDSPDGMNFVLGLLFNNGYSQSWTLLAAYRQL